MRASLQFGMETIGAVKYRYLVSKLKIIILESSQLKTLSCTADCCQSGDEPSRPKEFHGLVSPGSNTSGKEVMNNKLAAGSDTTAVSWQ